MDKILGLNKHNYCSLNEYQDQNSYQNFKFQFHNVWFSYSDTSTSSDSEDFISLNISAPLKYLLFAPFFINMLLLYTHKYNCFADSQSLKPSISTGKNALALFRLYQHFVLAHTLLSRDWTHMSTNFKQVYKCNKS